MSPAKLQSLLQAGIAHHRAGRLADAEQHYRQVRVAAPKHFDVLHLSGLVAYQLARLPEAVDLLGRAHRLDRKHAVCAMRYGLALLAMRQTAAAEASLRLAVELKPDFHEGWDNLAYGLKTQDRLAEAVDCHRRCTGLRPDYAVGWFNFGLTLGLMGRNTEALACHERALQADPTYAQGRLGRAQVLHKTHRMAEAVADYRQFLGLQPGNLEARSHLLLALHNLADVSREELFAEHAAFGRAAAAGVAATAAFPNLPEPGRRLRLAILSPDLRAHSCAFFLEPLISQLDPAQFELHLYHDHFREDAVSARLKGYAKVWRNFIGQPAAAVEAMIRTDAPDLLIDLAGHTGINCRLPLFARRLAPVQINYLGYPDTTGLKAMDYRFTDGRADPAPEADAWATERLVRFSECAWSFQPSADAPPVAPPPVLANGRPTFGCFNNLGKVTDRMLAVWARILVQVPDAALLLKGEGLGEAEARARFAARLAAAGIAPDRVEMVERTADTASHLALYGRMDVSLDTFPYHGTTTTCEALWMGVPVVTLRGDRHVARVGDSLLHAVGHPEWIAASEDDYVRRACELARDATRLGKIRAGLRADLARSILLDHAGQSRRWADALRSCWQTWCRQAAAAA